MGYFGIGASAGAVGTVTGGAAMGVLGGLGGIAGGSIAGMVSGATSGFILGGGNMAMAGGNFGDIMLGAMNGMSSGAIAGAVMGGVGGGLNSYFKGENIWNGSSIAPGRNAFPLKNTPIEALERHNPNAYLPAEQPNIALLDSPTSAVPEAANINSPLQPDLNPSFDGTSFITTPEGVTHDLLPTVNRINAGKTFTFRHDGTIFNNDKSLLPILPDGSYKEFVHLTPGLTGRAGSMRVIVGNNGAWWFTPDHYLTFIRIKF